MKLTQAQLITGAIAAAAAALVGYALLNGIITAEIATAANIIIAAIAGGTAAK